MGQGARGGRIGIFLRARSRAGTEGLQLTIAFCVFCDSGPFMPPRRWPRRVTSRPRSSPLSCRRRSRAWPLASRLTRCVAPALSCACVRLSQNPALAAAEASIRQVLMGAGRGGIDWLEMDLHFGPGRAPNAKRLPQLAGLGGLLHAGCGRGGGISGGRNSGVRLRS